LLKFDYESEMSLFNGVSVIKNRLPTTRLKNSLSYLIGKSVTSITRITKLRR